MEIAPKSKEFLVCLFTDLRRDLVGQADEGGQGSPGQLAIFDALLTGLARGEMSDDAAVREYVVGLAKATDEENKYEQATLEHNAFAELVRALTARGEADSR